MIRLISLVPIPKFINEQPEWWTDMSVAQQKQYLSTYEKSKHSVVPDNPSGKEERDDIKKTSPLSDRKGKEVDLDYEQTEKGGHIIGVEHRQDVSKELDIIKDKYNIFILSDQDKQQLICVNNKNVLAKRHSF